MDAISHSLLSMLHTTRTGQIRAGKIFARRAKMYACQVVRTTRPRKCAGSAWSCTRQTPVELGLRYHKQKQPKHAEQEGHKITEKEEWTVQRATLKEHSSCQENKPYGTQCKYC